MCFSAELVIARDIFKALEHSDPLKKDKHIFLDDLPHLHSLYLVCAALCYLRKKEADFYSHTV